MFQSSAWSDSRRLLAWFVFLYVILAVVITWPFLFGDRAFAYTDIGTDTFVQFYPLNIAHAQQLATGEGLGWSFSLGLGGYIGTHFDPFWMLQGLLPESAQLGARIYAYLLKIGLGGLFFALYLRLIGIRTNLAVLGGIAYAFSDYATINGQWDLHGTEVFHFAVLLYLLERYLRSGHVVFAVGIGLLLGGGHTFNIFTSALFSLIYIIARAWLVAEPRGLVPHVRSMAGLATWVFVGILVMAPLQLPSLLYFLDSPRVTGDHVTIGSIIRSLVDVNDWKTLAATVFGFLGKNSLGVGNAYSGWANYLEGPGFYVGFPFLLLASQLATRDATPTERRLFWLAVIGIFLYVTFPAFRYAAFGFNHVAFRISTLWISMLILVLGSFGLQKTLRGGLSLPAAIATLLFLALLCGMAGFFSGIFMDPRYLATFGVFVFVYAGIFLLRRKNRQRHLVIAVICTFLLELVVVVRPSLVNRVAVGKDGSSTAGNYQDGTAEALDWIRSRHADTDFYRVEKDYFSVFLLDSLVQGYRGIRSYFFHGAGITRFVDMMHWPRTTNHSNYIDSDGDRGYVLDMLGVKYVLARSRERDADPGSRHLMSVGNVEIYERPYARSLAVLHSRLIDEAGARSKPQDELDLLLTDSLVVPDLQALEAQGIAVVHDVKERVAVDVPVTIHGDRQITGQFQNDRPRMIAFSIPFDRGWQLYVDNAADPLPLIRVDFGLTGAVVPSGVHTFELRYETPGRKVAWGVSLAGLLLCGGGLFFMRRRRWPVAV